MNTKALLRWFAVALLTCLFLRMSGCSKDTKPAAPAPAIAVNSPAKGAVFQTGEPCTLSWKTTGDLGEYVVIQLYLDTNVIFQYPSVPASDGFFVIPSLNLISPLGPDTGYRFRIYPFSDPTQGWFSGSFTLASSYDGLFSIVAPDSHAVWSAGQTYDIRWTKSGNPGKHVNLLLYQNTAFLQYLANGLPASDTLFSWNVPTSGLFDGSYRIKIISVEDFRFSSLSQPFTLHGFH